ncbi:MAG: RNA-binding protein [Paracoccaceae bacterium]
MTRGGADKAADGPERRCIVTGESQPKRGLIRFVLSPDGMIVPDLAGKLPGRGLWVAADRAALDKAGKGVFSRAAKTPALVPDGLTDLVEAALARRVVDLVSLARKGARAVAGFEKVKGWLSDGRVKVLLQASDGSDRGKGKLWTPEGARWFGCLKASELGMAFGRDSVIHAALAAGGLAERVVEEAAKLTGLRPVDGALGAGKEQKSE